MGKGFPILGSPLPRSRPLTGLSGVPIIIVTGAILQLKKEVNWIQPPTRQGIGSRLSISFDDILKVASTVPEADIQSWDDIDRLDVRPGKGMLKVRCRNRW